MVARRVRRGLTALELTVVVVIILVLISMLLPAIQAARESVRRASCANNLTQLILAIKHYETLHRVYPPGSINSTGPIDSRPIGYHASWITQILPLIEQGNLYRSVDFQGGMYSVKNAAARKTEIDLLSCPSAWSAGFGPPATSSYAAVHHDVESPIDVDNHGSFFLNSRLRHDDIRDGHSQTLFLGEKRIRKLDDLGWTSGTRATLRNTGWLINQETRTLGSASAQPRDSDFDPFLDPNIMQPMAFQPDRSASSTLTPEQGADASSDDPNGTSDPREVPGSREPEPTTDVESPPASSWDTFEGEVAESMGGSLEDDPAFGIGSPLPTRPFPVMIVGGFGSDHPQGANFACGDGSIRYLTDFIDQRVYQQLGHRDDDQLLNDDAWR